MVFFRKKDDCQEKRNPKREILTSIADAIASIEIDIDRNSNAEDNNKRADAILKLAMAYKAIS